MGLLQEIEIRMQIFPLVLLFIASGIPSNEATVKSCLECTGTSGDCVTGSDQVPRSVCGPEVNEACRAAAITKASGEVEFQRMCCKGDDCKAVHGDVDGGHLDQVSFTVKNCNTMDPRSSSAPSSTTAYSLAFFFFLFVAANL